MRGVAVGRGMRAPLRKLTVDEASSLEVAVNEMLERAPA
jgi:hypothetical protein